MIRRIASPVSLQRSGQSSSNVHETFATFSNALGGTPDEHSVSVLEVGVGSG